MNAIEELLDEVIRPSTDVVDRHWSEVIADGQTRRRSQAGLGSAGVALAVALLFLFQAVLGDFGGDFNVLTTPPNGEAVPGVDGEVSVFPSATEVFALAGERPAGRAIAAWLFVLGLPLFAASVMWRRTTGVGLLDRTDVGDHAFARAAGAALGTIVLLSATVGAALFALYDPFAAQTGTSWLTLAMALCTKVAFWVAAAAAIAEVRVRPHGRLVWISTLVIFAVSSPLAYVGSAFAWHQTVATEPPGRGLVQLLFQGDSVFLGPASELTAANAWFALLLAVLLVVVGLVWARQLLSSGSAGLMAPQIRPEPTVQRFSGEVFLFLGAALLIGLVVNQDVRSRQSMYVPSLSIDTTEMGEVSVSRTVTGSIFDENALVEIIIRGGDEPIADVTNAELFRRSPLDLRQTGQEELATLSRIGVGAVEIWEIRRDPELNTITVSAWETFSLPPMNTAIFLSAVLFLAATSRRLRGLHEEEVVGRQQASWFAIIGASVIGGRLVASLYALEADVGDLESRNGQSLFEIYTAGGEPMPNSLAAISGWFFPYNFVILLPLFGLAMIGLRRLQITKRSQIVVWAVAALACIAMQIRFGDLINDWLDYFLD